MAPVPAAQEVEGLWLATFQRALGRASHDVKDALNGVSVNLEVVRGRAARADAPAAAVAPFAEAAAQQLERLTTLVEAVLALGRAERQPADVAVTLRRVGAVCGASSSSADAEVVVEMGDVESAVTSVPGDAVRLALAAPLLALVNGGDRTARATAVRCVVSEVEGATVVTIAAAGRRAAMPGDVADAVRAAGVRWSGGAEAGARAGAESNDLSLVFPRP
jgi:signal transduction histidine kinase